MSKRALVFGVTGQGGAYLSHLLLKKGYKVQGLSGDVEVATLSRMEQLGVIGKFQLYSANLNDVTQGHGLLHGEATMLFAYAGYQGSVKRPESTCVKWYLAMCPVQRRALKKNLPWGSLLDKAAQFKASVRAKVVHLFRVIKCQFGFIKVRYKGLAKNAAKLVTLFALSNLWMGGKRMNQGALA